MQGYDACGNTMTTGGANFSVEVKGLDKDVASVTDRGDGSYAVGMCIPSEGRHEVTVKLAGSPVANMPLSLTVFR